MSSSSIELSPLPNHSIPTEDHTAIAVLSTTTLSPAEASGDDGIATTTTGTGTVPPADGGKDAWLFLAASFMVEALVWGFPFSFGLFQEYYSQHEDAFRGQGQIAVIGTCAMGVMYLSAPIIFAGLTKWPQLRRTCVVVGLFTMCTALAASSFSTKVWQLILTQGVLYAVGGGLAYSPTILFVNEWFIRRKGLAFGIMWAGTGVAGVVLPLVMNWLLTTYGFRTTLRIWTLSLFTLTFPLLHYIKPRLPPSHTHPRTHTGRRALFDLSFLTTRHFLIMQACNTIEALGYFLPAVYLPLFAQQTLGSTPLAAAASVIALNTASVVGCVLMGTLTDRWAATTCLLVSSVGAAAGVLLLWGAASPRAPLLLYVFAAVYGLFAGSYSSTWTGVIRDVQKKSENADAGLVFAFLAFGRGVGNVLSGPLSEALVRGKPWQGEAGMAYGTGYGPLIAFTGVSALLGGLSFVVRRVGWL